MIIHVLLLLFTIQTERGVVVLSGEGRTMIRAELGHDISLDCDFGDDDGRHNHQSRLRSLYSIKWYRDDREFFRYIPTDSPPYTIFLVPGIEVDDLSTPTNIILTNVSLLTSGTFKCEISGGTPR